MTDPFGATVGILGLAGLLKTCIDYFELIQLGRHYSQDYEITYRKFRAQRVRLITWGMATGIIGARDYDRNLDQPHIHEEVDGILNVLKLLFENGTALVQKYGMQPITAAANRTGPQDLVLREPFERFRTWLAQNQSRASLLTTSKWAITDRNKFRVLVQDITELMDALQQITESMGALMAQQEILHQEMNRARVGTEAETVEVLNQAVSDTHDGLRLTQGTDHRIRSPSPTLNVSRVAQINNPDSVNLGLTPRTPELTLPEIPPNPQATNQIETPSTSDVSRLTLPPHPTIPEDVLRQINLDRHNEFTLGSDHIQPFLESTNMAMAMRISEDQASISELLYGNGTIRGGPLYKRMSKELKDFIKRDTVTFVSLSPINNNFRDLLGVVRGPPDSPYYGGLFFVRIYVDSNYPFSSPIFQFLTKIYHPNIDEHGRICTFGDEWSSALTLSTGLVTLSALLSLPIPEEPLRLDVAAQYLNDRQSFERVARAYTKLYATGTRPEVVPPTPEHFWWDTATVEVPAEQRTAAEHAETARRVAQSVTQSITPDLNPSDPARTEEPPAEVFPRAEPGSNSVVSQTNTGDADAGDMYSN